ncbi:MAG: MBL fold metallo-hydrolase [Candidatus Krumholzibacteria bacterium]|nr:MBL fold metallo-hydrolase [Candidatus Krumholzibacteria bacterium]
MLEKTLRACAILVCLAVSSSAPAAFETDVVKTARGDLTIAFIGHGTLMFSFRGTTIHVDPWSRLADYAKLPKADFVLLTHDHPDHLDPAALKLVCGEKTAVILTEECRARGIKGTVMKNGDTTTVSGIGIEAVPAYNIAGKRPDGRPYHPRGSGNGYVMTFGGTRVYVAGDTENTPEMKRLRRIDIAFLPMNLPYTMTPEMVADAARAFKPKILYPYHLGETDASRLVELLKGNPDVEVRIRKMK